MVAPAFLPDRTAEERVKSIVGATVINAVQCALKCQSEGVPFETFATLIGAYSEAGSQLLLEQVKVTLVAKPTDPSQN